MRVDGAGTNIAHDYKAGATRQIEVHEPIVQASIQIEKEEKNVAQIEMSTNAFPTNLQFVYHEELNEYFVEVIDPVTNEVLKEIPPKKMLDMYAEMVMFSGIFIDEKG